jgi:hypothetical protein
VTAGGMENFADVGLARGPNGVLHVIWTGGKTGSMTVWDTPIQASGAVGKPSALVRHLLTATFPDATLSGRTLHAFWNEESNAGDAKSGTQTSAWPAGAKHWNPVTGDTKTESQSWDFSVAAATGADGSPWVGFVDNGNQGFEVLHVGHAERQLKAAGCCVYNAGIGADSKTSAAWLTWYSNVTHKFGIWAQQLRQDGTKVGGPIRLPGSNAGGSALSVDQRTTATGLGHGLPGVYTTYLSGWPVAHKVDLIRLGAKVPVTVSALTGTMGSTLAADPFGRLWVAWYKGNDVFLRRAASGGSKFGPTIRLAAPEATSTLWKVYLSAQAKRVDVLALLSVHGKTAYWSTQVLAPKPK